MNNRFEQGDTVYILVDRSSLAHSGTGYERLCCAKVVTYNTISVPVDGEPNEILVYWLRIDDDPKLDGIIVKYTQLAVYGSVGELIEKVFPSLTQQEMVEDLIFHKRLN